MNKCNALAITFLMGLVLFYSAFAFEASHPPTFQQMKEASNHDNDGASLIHESLKYTANDGNRLRKEKNVAYIIGAAYQAERSEAIALLMRHISLVEELPLGLSLLIGVALQVDNAGELVDMDDLTDAFMRIDPRNSYPYYLKAGYYAKLKNAEQCVMYMEKANNKQHFTNYFKELSRISIQTSLFLGYSEFAAQYYASGLQHDIMIFNTLSKFLVKDAANPKSLEECRKMGIVLRRNSATLLTELISYGVLKRALKKMKRMDELKEVEREKEKFSRILDMAYDIHETYDIPEKRLVEYYNDLYAHSETYAILKLSREYPVTELNDTGRRPR